jgi:hypothetical protein
MLARYTKGSYLFRPRCWLSIERIYFDAAGRSFFLSCAHSSSKRKAGKASDLRSFACLPVCLSVTHSLYHATFTHSDSLDAHSLALTN